MCRKHSPPNHAFLRVVVVELCDGRRSSDDMSFRVFRIEEYARPFETPQERPYGKQDIAALCEAVEIFQIALRGVRSNRTDLKVSGQATLGKNLIGSFERRLGTLPMVIDIRYEARVFELRAARGKIFARHPVDGSHPLQTCQRYVLFEIMLGIICQTHNATVASIVGDVSHQFPKIVGTPLKVLLIGIAEILGINDVHGERV